MEFKKLGLSEIILSQLEKIGYVEATPIQELSIPKILENKDMIGMAQTGTGKTAAYALPILEKLINLPKDDKSIKALILCPTRELALQIRDSIKEYSSKTSIKCGVVLGGVNQRSQVELLRSGVDILVATPGRLLDLIDQKFARIDNIKVLVLDEADTMLDMGFIREMKQIISKTPKNRQTLLFSATINSEVKKLSAEFMINPITIKIESEQITADKINQELYYVDKGNKTSLLLDLLNTKEKKNALIFTRTKHGANRLAEQLEKSGIKASIIHGNKSQASRVKALLDFKTGNSRVMIATDIAARGIDISDLAMVINYDVSEKPELYVHRIGRTARAGKEGIAISLCSSAEMADLKAIEKYTHFTIKEIKHKYPMILDEKKEPQKNNSNRSNRGNVSNKQKSPAVRNSNPSNKSYSGKSRSSHHSSNNNKRVYK